MPVNFYCPKMKATLSKQRCYERQLIPRQLGTGAVTRWLYDSPADDFCRSGLCELGCFNKRLFDRGLLKLEPSRVLEAIRKMAERKERE